MAARSKASPRGWLRALLALGVALASFLIVPSAKAATCSDVLLIGARGSGQSQDEVHRGFRGLGPEVASVAYWLKSDLAKVATGPLTVDYKAVQYPAAHVRSLYRNTDKYFNGLSAGVSSARSLINDALSTCEGQVIVLSGFSQGAMVMHRVLQQLEASNSAQLANISGAVLVGDGDRIVSDTNVAYGGAHWASRSGVGHSFRSQSGSSAVKFKTVGPRVRSVCSSQDPVCDYNGRLSSFARVDAHLKYRNSRALTEATDAAALDAIAYVRTMGSLNYVTFTNDGKLRVGMTLDEARAVYPNLQVQELANGCAQWMVQDASNPSITAYALITPDSQGRALGIFTPQSAKTDRGVGVGSTLAAIRTAYRGYPIEEVDSPAGHVVLVEGDNSYLGFNDLDGDGDADGVTVGSHDMASGFELCSG